MASVMRIEFPGAVYHITGRGNERKKIFRHDRDKHDFFDILALVLNPVNARIVQLPEE
jgi:REP element-mobilizing transposase RayT